jgi:hypothetical protein
MATKKFIQGAIKHPGALTRKAKNAHESLAQFMAHPPKNASTQTKRQIAFAKALKSFNHKGKK